MKNSEVEISAEEMTILDINSEFIGVSRSELMKNAGKSIAKFITALNKDLKIERPKIAFFCHTGGNGGDGFVAASMLNNDYIIDVYLTGNESKIKSKSALQNFHRLKKKNNVNITEICVPSDLSKIHINSYDILIDALLGTGLNTTKLKDPVLSTIKHINTFDKEIISVDIPSGLMKNGLPAEVIVKPTYTISLHKPKRGTYKYGFKINIVDIGIPKDTKLFTGPGLFTLLPERKEKSHKGQNGRLLVIGGSDIYHGAPILAAKAALSLNVDLVTIVVPISIATAVRSHDTRYIVYTYNEENLSTNVVNEIIKPILKKNDVVLIGPGLGSDNKTIIAVQHLISLISSEQGLVVDADGLKAVNAGMSIPNNCILTPHIGEFKLITKIEIESKLALTEKLKIGQKSIQNFNPEIVWLIKGAIDLIITNNRYHLNHTGKPEMTVGGTGDILAGLTAGFRCFINDSFIAASLSAFLIGMACEIQLKEKKWFNIELLFDYIPKTLIEIQKFINEEKNIISDLIANKKRYLN